MTARHKLLSCCVLIATHPPFLFTKLFCHQDGGIAIPPFAQHHIYASLVKGEVLSPERIRATTRGIATPLSPRPAPPHQPFQTRTIPLAFRRGVSLLLPLHRILPPSQPLQKDNNPSPRTTTLASLVKGEVLSPERIRATTGGIATPLSHSLFVGRVSVCAYTVSHPHYHISLFVGE